MRVRGAGGKDGGGAGGLQEAPDTLRSVAYAQIVDLIAEGEIEGFPTTSTNPAALLANVYFDGTPVANADGSLNFKGATFDFRPGTQGQTHIEGVDASASEIAVGVEVKHSAAVVRTITDTTVNAIRVTLRVNSFYQLQSDGSMQGTAVEYTIEVQSNGGGYVPVIDHSIQGKSSGEYQRAHRLEFSAYGPAPWDIRVTRLTADHDADTSIEDALWWDSYTEIVEAKFRFPNSALAAIKIDSSQFGHIPTRGYDLKLLRIQVPSNYAPVARTYTGSWDGTFKIAWSDNPAWCFYDLLTTARYGLGSYIAAAQIDKWALYQIAQYCDGMVDNGTGGQEPRFTCNLYLQKRQDAYTALTQFASVFRGMIYWGAGSLVSIQDAPSDPVAVYAAANVIEGQFTYSGASRRARHTVALVQWNNPNNLYRQEVEYVEDRAGIARYGVVQTEVVAVGCTSRGQAQRVGRWLLYSERQETETVAFRTGIDGVKARPGQVIQIADAHRAGVRRGGRIVAATTTQITLDAVVTLDPADTYTLSVIGPGGVLAQESVQAPSQTTTTAVITLTVALATAPATGAVWVLSGTDVAATTWRVVGVTEPEKAMYEITAVAHAPGKYAEIESGIQLESPPVTTLNSVPAEPTNLVLTQSAHQSGSSVSLSISASWSPVVGARRYQVAYQVAGGNVVHLPDTETPHVDIPLSEAGTYTATVRAVNGVGRRSPSVNASAYYDGSSLAITLAQPVATAVATADGIDLSWGSVTHAENYLVERSGNGATGWIAVAVGVQTVHWRDIIADLLVHYYRVTAVGHFGRSSPPSALVSAFANLGSTRRDYLNLGRPKALWRVTGAVKVGADDISKHSEVTQHIGGLGITTVNLDSQVADGPVHSRVLGTALTNGKPDLSKAGVIGRTAGNITETTGRKWAGESGADITGGHTAADTSKVNGVSATAISPIGALMPAQSGADKTSSNTAAAIAGQGALATKSAVDLATTEVLNKTAGNITETTGRKWAGESGADITGGHTAADTSKVNGVSATAISPIGALMPAQSGADKTSSNTAAAIAGQGALATKSAVDLATTEVLNKTAGNITETTGRKWAGESGANVTETRTSLQTSNLDNHTQDNLSDGPYYARILGSQLAAGVHKIAIAGSTIQVGDNRNLRPVLAAGAQVAWVNLSITYTASAGLPATATISVSAAQLAGLRDAGATVNYNASSASVSGTNGTTTTYYLYYSDPAFAGGTRTLNSATAAASTRDSLSNVYIGAVDVAFPASGGGSGSGSGGLCVADDMWLRPHARAGAAVVGDTCDCMDYPATGRSQFTRRLIAVEHSAVPCVRLTTECGAALVCSCTTPFDLVDGGMAYAPDMAGRIVITDRGPETVARVDRVGVTPVSHCHLGGVSYAAGVDPRHRIFSHNTLKP